MQQRKTVNEWIKELGGRPRIRPSNEQPLIEFGEL